MNQLQPSNDFSFGKWKLPIRDHIRSYSIIDSKKMSLSLYSNLGTQSKVRIDLIAKTEQAIQDAIKQLNGVPNEQIPAPAGAFPWCQLEEESVGMVVANYVAIVKDESPLIDAVLGPEKKSTAQKFHPVYVNLTKAFDDPQWVSVVGKIAMLFESALGVENGLYFTPEEGDQIIAAQEYIRLYVNGKGHADKIRVSQLLQDLKA
ncbi:MAG: hypothetical protein JSS32_07685 [Verrucomicrobia bacterium]|nr:hypothetical protein [Verrucomicrobiota bacterium]